jgi:hypothetical protein
VRRERGRGIEVCVCVWGGGGIAAHLCPIPVLILNPTNPHMCLLVFSAPTLSCLPL